MTSKTIIVGIAIFAFVVGSMTTATVYAADKPNGQPFNAIWEAIGILQTQIDEIELTPGPAGPQGEQGETGPAGPQGEQGESGVNGQGISKEQIYEVSRTDPITPNLGGSHAVLCRAGDIAINGGYHHTDLFFRGDELDITGSFTTYTDYGNNQDRHTVSFQNYSPSYTYQLTVYVNCLDVTP